MEITTETRDGREIISLSGKLDSLAAAHMEQVMTAQVREGAILEIDMKEANYICSAALRVFLKTQKDINKLQHAEMVILHCNQGVKDIFEMTGFSGILNIKEDQ